MDDLSFHFCYSDPVNANTIIIDGAARQETTELLSAFETSPGVYEVIRIIEGCPLFLPDHLARLRRSAHLAGFEISSGDEEIHDAVDLLISHIGKGTFSVKIVFSAPGRNTGTFCISAVPRRIPAKKDYLSGVSTRLVHLARRHPQIKAINSGYSDRVQHEIAEDHIFEILLVDEHDRITEGGKSNVFFIRNNTLITPPRREVLPGITRSKVKDIARKEGISFIEEEVHTDDLKDFEAVFLTGTSIFILPVATIDSRVYTSAENPLVLAIMKHYRQLTEEFISALSNTRKKPSPY